MGSLGARLSVWWFLLFGWYFPPRKWDDDPISLFGWVLTGGTAAENGSGAPPASVSDRVVSSWSSSTEQTCALHNEIPGKVQEETTRSTRFCFGSASQLARGFDMLLHGFNPFMPGIVLFIFKKNFYIHIIIQQIPWFCP